MKKTHYKVKPAKTTIIFTLITTLFLFNSCSYFSNNKEEKLKSDELKWKQEREIKANKDYQYINQSVSYQTHISKDTVAIVLREYYKDYEGFVFNKKTSKLEEIDELRLEDDVKHKLDFINDIIKKHFVNEKSTYLIFDKIDFIFNMQNTKDELETINYSVDELESNNKD